MVNRTKNDTIHLRVGTAHKRYLTALANLENTTETAHILDWLERAAAEKQVDGCMGAIPLADAVGYAELGAAPVLKMLRMFYLAPAALGQKERHKAQTIIENKFYFAGDSAIFAEDECHHPRMELIPKINVSAIAAHLTVLSDYAKFVIGNPKVRIAYPEYRKATDADMRAD